MLDYEKQERAKEVAELDSQLAQSERALQTASKMVDSQLARAEELAEIGDKFQKRNEECFQMMERLMEQMKAKQGVAEQLKLENQMQWVGMMNNIRHCAEEMVLRDIIYV